MNSYQKSNYQEYLFENMTAGEIFQKIFNRVYGDYYGEKKTIMDVLKEDNKLPNLMQIINKKEFGFNEIIEKTELSWMRERCLKSY